MHSMFLDARAFNQDLSGWCVSNITSEPTDFASNSALANANKPIWGTCPQPLASFRLASNGVTVVCPDAAEGETGVVTINGEAVTFTKRVKREITNENAATTCTSGITDMVRLFFSEPFFNEDIGHWDVSSVTDMSIMFDRARAFNSDISAWDVSSVTDMHRMFEDTRAFNSDISAWDVSSVTDMNSMFEDATAFNSNISAWDVSSVTDMSYMFREASSFNSDISNWDVSSVTDMSYMFRQASSFNRDISRWNVSKVTDLAYMFDKATIFNADISNWDVGLSTDFTYMFREAKAFNQDLSGWDTSNSFSTFGMFLRATSFNSGKPAGVSKSAEASINSLPWDMSGVTDMGSMFSGAESFNQDVSGWNTQNVASMAGMFNGATGFDGDLSSWNLTAVTQLDDVRAAGDTLWYDADGTLIPNDLANDTLAFEAGELTFRILAQDSLVAGFLGNTAMSTENVDALLVSMSQQSLQPTVKSVTTYPSQFSDTGVAALEQLATNAGVTVTTGGKRTQVTLSQQLQAGWNLVSVPVFQSSNTVSAIFPWASAAQVYGFNGAYTEVDSLLSGRGYWLWSEQARSLDWDDFSHPPMIRSVRASWNLLGSSSFNLPLTQLVDRGNLLDRSSAVSFQNNSYVSVTEVAPSEAYWIKSSGAGSIDIPFNQPATSSTKDQIVSKFAAQINNDVFFSTLTVSDGNASIPLRVGLSEDGGLGVNNADDRILPPLPPEGAFDARMQLSELGYRVKVLDSDLSNEQRIAINYTNDGASPIQISWNTENLADGWEYFLESADGAATLSVDIRSLNGVFIPSQEHSSVANGVVLVVRPETTTSIGEEDALPNSLSLSQNYPNPFNPSTLISYSLPEVSAVRLEVFNLQGQRIAVLVNGVQAAGQYQFNYDASALPTGLYVYRISTPYGSMSKKMTLMK